MTAGAANNHPRLNGNPVGDDPIKYLSMSEFLAREFTSEGASTKWRQVRLGDLCVAERVPIMPGSPESFELPFLGLEHIEGNTGRILRDISIPLPRFTPMLEAERASGQSAPPAAYGEDWPDVSSKSIDHCHSMAAASKL